METHGCIVSSVATDVLVLKIFNKNIRKPNNILKEFNQLFKYRLIDTIYKDAGVYYTNSNFIHLKFLSINFVSTTKRNKAFCVTAGC